MNTPEKKHAFFLKGSSNGILMLHGLTASPNDFEHFIEKLSSQNYTISAPLLSGHGSSVNDLRQVSWPEWFSDVKAAYYHLQDNCKKIIIIGQSMGATLALHLASHYKINALVLLAPGLFFKNKATVFLPFISKIKKYIAKSDGPDIKNWVSRKKALSYDQIPTHSINEAGKLFKHVKQDLAEVNSPTLIFHAINDHVIDFKSSEYIYKNISSKKKRLIALNDSYHVLSLDNEKNIILKEIQSFIKPIFSS